MKTLLYSLFICTCLSFSNVLIGQDIHFSQYEALSPSLNPAFTGTVHLRQDGTSLRLAGIYRNQWSSVLQGASYQTYGASFDMAFCTSNDDKDAPTWGLGLGLIHDESGTLTSTPEGRLNTFPLQRDYVNLNGAFMVNLKPFYLSGGFRFRYTLSRLKTDDLRYDEQFDGVGGFDNTITGEFDDIDRLNSNNIDLGGGLVLFWLGSKLNNSKFSFSSNTALIVGASVDYIYQPLDITFIDSNTPSRRARRLTFHGKYTHVFNKFGLNLKAVYQHQSPYQQWVGRADLFYSLGGSSAIIMGAGYRQGRSFSGSSTGDAFLTNIGLAFQQFTLSINYDVNTSSLSEVSNHYGALEFSVTYRWKKKKKDCFDAPTGCPYEDVKHAIFF